MSHELRTPLSGTLGTCELLDGPRTTATRLMGGTIWLDTSPGVGSTFHFAADLPADDTTRRGPQPGAPDPDPGVAIVRWALPTERCNNDGWRLGLGRSDVQAVSAAADAA